MFKRFTILLASWAIAAYVLLLRWTCREQFENDPRVELRKRGENYVFSFLHAHQLAVIVKGEPGTGAMVSRSADGELVVPTLKLVGCVPVRGSKWRPSGGKGGREAVESLIQHVSDGRPAAIAVDGPRGPRGKVHKGIAAISQQTGAAVINLVAIPSKRIVIHRAWDRLQIPLPFCTLRGTFSDPIYPLVGEKLEAYRQRIETSLQELEQRMDPDMASATASTTLDGNQANDYDQRAA